MKIGKDQTYSRELNSSLVLQMLSEGPYSGTELADELSLSNATISSIIKSLEKLGIIRIKESTSISGYGRKRVLYEINPTYGYILSINISNLHAVIAISDLHHQIIKKNDIPIEKYDAEAIHYIVDETKILIGEDIQKQTILHIVISVPGRVNLKTGELALSKQFDSELFKEKNYIQNAFLGEFPNVDITLINDINLQAIGEQYSGNLKDVNNACYLSIDYGVGGAIFINSKLFTGDLGYAGEFGLIKYHKDNQYLPIDEFISLRSLCDQASKMLDKKINRDELFKLYENNKDIHQLVINSAHILGKSLREFIEVMDIAKYVLSGRVTFFKDEYLFAVNEELKDLINQPEVTFSLFDSDIEILGASYVGMDKVLKKIINKSAE